MRPDRGVDHDIKVYPGAARGFINDHDPAGATLLLTVLTKVSGTRYHEPRPATPAAASPDSSAGT